MTSQQLTYKDYLKVTIPFMISTATQPLLGAANTAIMGHMDEAFYIAAVSLGVILFNNIYWLFGFLRVSTTSFSAQALGKECAKSTFLSLARPFILALVISFIFLLIYPWLFDYYISYMKPDIQVINLMKNYCDIIIWGAPFVLLNYVALGWLMGQMMIRQTMYMQISMNILNIALSFILTFGLDMNIFGVAYASLIAQIYGCIIGFIAIIKSKKIIFIREYIAQLCQLKPFISMMKVNTDLMLRTICLLTINNLFAMAGSSLGTLTLATNAVILEIIFILAYFFDGMANGVSVFSGKAFGQKDKHLLKQTLQISLRCLAIWATFCAIICYLGKDYFISLMTNLPEVATYANEYSFYLCLYALFAGVGLLLYGMYTGIGHTASIRNMMFIAVAFFFIAQQILMSYFGNHGIWLTYVFTYLLESIILVLFLPSLKRKFD